MEPFAALPKNRHGVIIESLISEAREKKSSADGGSLPDQNTEKERLPTTRRVAQQLSLYSSASVAADQIVNVCSGN